MDALNFLSKPLAEAVPAAAHALSVSWEGMRGVALSAAGRLVDLTSKLFQFRCQARVYMFLVLVPVAVLAFVSSMLHRKRDRKRRKGAGKHTEKR